MSTNTTNTTEFIEIDRSAVTGEIMLRVWQDHVTAAAGHGLLADVRLTRAQAFTLAESLLRAIDPALTPNPATVAAVFSRLAAETFTTTNA